MYNYTHKDLVRFWKNVQILGEDSCWEWQKLITNGGYGRFSIRGWQCLSHRFAYWCCYGVFPDKLKVCHSCDNPKCCNPKHLWLGTQKDNVKDSLQKNRRSMAGENNINSKLTKFNIQTIKTLKDSHSSNRLSKLFKVHVSTINRIKNGTRWL